MIPLALVVLIASGQAAQPDTTDPAAYVPLRVGNVWEYVEGRGASEIRTGRAVVGDTVVAGVAYVRIEDVVETATDRSVSSRVVRYDTARAQVVERVGAAEAPLTCSLDAAWGSTLDACTAPELGGAVADVGVSGHYVSPGGGILVDGRPVDFPAFKVFFLPGTDHSVRYGSGVGRLPTPNREEMTYLRQVRADGTVREVGSRRVFVAEAGRPVAGVAVHVAPNPTASTAAVRVALDQPSDVRVEVFDARGRRVLSETYLGPRDASIPLPVEGWAPGRYWVRVTSGHDSVGVSLVRVARRP